MKIALTSLDLETSGQLRLVLTFSIDDQHRIRASSTGMETSYAINGVPVADFDGYNGMQAVPAEIATAENVQRIRNAVQVVLDIAREDLARRAKKDVENYTMLAVNGVLGSESLL